MVLAVAVLAAAAFSAQAQDGDIAAGHAFARGACRACHIVERQPSAPRRIDIGPPFRDIANAPGMTPTAIRVFLTSMHPKMPSLIPTPEETGDLAAYILSLREHAEPTVLIIPPGASRSRSLARRPVEPLWQRLPTLSKATTPSRGDIEAGEWRCCAKPESLTLSNLA